MNAFAIATIIGLAGIAVVAIALLRHINNRDATIAGPIVTIGCCLFAASIAVFIFHFTTEINDQRETNNRHADFRAMIVSAIASIEFKENAAESFKNDYNVILKSKCFRKLNDGSYEIVAPGVNAPPPTPAPIIDYDTTFKSGIRKNKERENIPVYTPIPVSPPSPIITAKEAQNILDGFNSMASMLPDLDELLKKHYREIGEIDPIFVKILQFDSSRILSGKEKFDQVQQAFGFALNSLNEDTNRNQSSSVRNTLEKNMILFLKAISDQACQYSITLKYSYDMILLGQARQLFGLCALYAASKNSEIRNQLQSILHKYKNKFDFLSIYLENKSKMTLYTINNKSCSDISKIDSRLERLSKWQKVIGSDHNVIKLILD